MIMHCQKKPSGKGTMAVKTVLLSVCWQSGPRN